MKIKCKSTQCSVLFKNYFVLLSVQSYSVLLSVKFISACSYPVPISAVAIAIAAVQR